MRIDGNVVASVSEAAARWPRAADGRLRVAVAFSGGVDSTVLLAALLKLEPAPAVRALHVDHGLHPDSENWASHCRRIAAMYGVSCEVRNVQPSGGGQANIEARARELRYFACKQMMQAGEILVTGHHADDQLETLLYRLLRGSGVRGMRGIAEFDEFGPGFMARPLLAVSRNEIAAQARAWQLEWLNDPSNSSVRFDRNFLRAAIIPRLASRWPSAASAAVRMGRAMGDAEQILADMARLDIAACGDAPDRLPCATLRALSAARRKNLLRHALRRLGLPAPDAEHLRRVSKLVGDSGISAVQWPGGQARMYRDALYLLPSLSAAPHRDLLRPGSASQAFAGRVSLAPTRQVGIPDEWAREGLEIRTRESGDVFRPADRDHDQILKRWMQDQRIVPWMRDRVPLVIRHGRILAVADLALAAELGTTADDGPRWRIIWDGHPRVR